MKARSNMADQAYLLNDAEIQQFIVDGYTTVQADYPPSFHESIFRQIETVFEKEDNVGNNILPRVPQIQQVFDHPAVSGALTSLLGPGYVLNPHRHCHLNPPGRKGQSWHKDCYVFDHNIRHPRFHWVLAFYYPQDTTEDMGPSGLLPGMHAYRTVSDPDPEHTREPAVSVCGKAGTVALIHFDAWHRATPNVSANKRYMLKFQFVRTREPQVPSWNHSSSDWDAPARDRAVSLDVWSWLCGRCAPDALPPEDAGKGVPGLLEALRDESETVRLNGAFALGAVGEPAVPALIDALRREALASIEETTAKTPDNAHGTNPTAGCAAMALSVIGPPAVPALVDVFDDDHWWVRAVAVDVVARIGPGAGAAVPALLDRLSDDHWWVRRNAVEALGTVEAFSPATVRALTGVLADRDYRVRRNAAITLAKIGPSAAPAVPDLVKALKDDDRYNRFYAALALRRIGTPEAQSALTDALFTARWCSITTPEDLY